MRSRLFRVLIGAGVLALACRSAAAQCTPAWHTVGTGVSGIVSDLEVWDDGRGPAIYAGGSRSIPGGETVGFVRRFDGGGWALVGPDPSHLRVSALAESDWGGEPRLFAAGQYWTPGDYPIALQWDGARWSPVGPVQFKGGLAGAWVTDMVVAHSGARPSLFVSTTYSYGAWYTGSAYRWDGETLTSMLQLVGFKFPLGVYDLSPGWEPNEPGVFIGGLFAPSSGSTARSLARWNNGLFQVGGLGPNHPAVTFVELTTSDLLGGPALYVSGSFSQLAGVAAHNIARWDGQSWSPLGAGLQTAAASLAALDDGTRPALYASHGFPSPTVVSRWDGAAWTTVGPTFSSSVAVLAGLDDDGPGPNPAKLYAGGAFAGGVKVWGCPAPCYPDCDASSGLTIADFTCFQARFAAGEPYADCNASGVLTVGDFACFQTRYVAGCP